MSFCAALSVHRLAWFAASALVVLPLHTIPARAQQAAAPSAAPAPQGNDPVVARVDGTPIRLSDVAMAAQGLPESARAMPPQTLFPVLLDQMIDGHALAAEARKTGLDKDPDVKRQVEAATERALQAALLQKEVGPQVTDDAVKARYDREIAGKPGAEEVHARHILVADEATAKTIIAELKKGADFAALSKKYSKDPGAAQQGGDLGFFKKGDMVPEFADTAFALKDKEITQTPVRTQFGWHIIQTLEHRKAAPQPFEQAREDLRQQMIQEGVKNAVTRARASVSIERYNMDGSQPRATDTAQPPPSR